MSINETYNATSQDVVLTVDCNSLTDGNYNLGLAIGSVFVIFFVSVIGFMTPVLLKNKDHPFLRMSVVACACGGTGVVLTVGFVHILGDANKYLRDPCLSENFRTMYPSIADLFCCITVVVLILIDYVLRFFFEKKMKSKLTPEECSVFGDPCLSKSPTISPSHAMIEASTETGKEEKKPHSDSDVMEAGEVPTTSEKDEEKTRCRTTGTDFGATKNAHELTGTPSEKNLLGNPKLPSSSAASGKMGVTSSAEAVVPVNRLSNDVLLHRGALLFIELSVCTHSIPVGLALGLQKGAAFTTLFIAVIFHQILEGFGIGAAAIPAKYPLRTEIVLALMFATTAPIGIVMGIVLEQSLNQHSSGYLLTVGTINAVAAGMLIYIALEHMNAISSKGRWMRTQSWVFQFYCLGFFVLACAALMVVGKWA